MKPWEAIVFFIILLALLATAKISINHDYMVVVADDCAVIEDETDDFCYPVSLVTLNPEQIETGKCSIECDASAACVMSGCQTEGFYDCENPGPFSDLLTGC